ncbi:DUF1127 domain-containing protein [Pseudooceanicola sp.]|uniref:DUF1127 domain-containing protein n=1 Tax=Pseudooceanicola sp. TaxID=1914328 RepID=UPI000C08EEA0|nr:hypothetical protein [Pseudooceanicola sp.]|tara:strand:- start:21946 stop:22158 length:213 start_codon:yes stop_codon:yes gene_type:complete
MSTLSQRIAITSSRPLSLIGATFSLLALGRSRQALADLDDRALEDIGVTEAQARREAARPVWDVPSNWLK